MFSFCARGMELTQQGFCLSLVQRVHSLCWGWGGVGPVRTPTASECAQSMLGVEHLPREGSVLAVGRVSSVCAGAGHSLHMICLGGRCSMHLTVVLYCDQGWSLEWDTNGLH